MFEYHVLCFISVVTYLPTLPHINTPMSEFGTPSVSFELGTESVLGFPSVQ